MDYTRQPFLFRLAKATRYLRLYGPRRTLAKVRGQYHMKRTYESLPRERGSSGGHVGIIGCGNFAYSNIAYFLSREYPGCIRAAMDIDIAKAASLFEQYGLAYYSDDHRRLIDDPAIDLIYIASNHASHAEYAIEALRAGKKVHIEKPHVVSFEQLRELCSTILETNGAAQLGFNRPRSPIGERIQKHLAGQTGAAMLNWFVAGHVIEPDHWYFKNSEGGRVLGNLCHWTDFVYQMVAEEDRYPITIRPTRAAKSDCDIAVTYEMGDGTIAAITFSGKGHAFEGVQERFTAHRGDVLIAMDNFSAMTVDVGARKLRYHALFRDHGHRATVLHSYDMTQPGRIVAGASVKYIWETGELFLATKQALEENCAVTISPYAKAKLSPQQPAGDSERERAPS